MVARYAMMPQRDLDFLGITLPNPPIIQRESRLAHQYLDGLSGIEIGAAAYQPFGLDAPNVAPRDPLEQSLYQQIQMRVCGFYRVIDHFGEADALPFGDHSQDFVLSSHVIEHVPNPIAAFIEWQRVLKTEGFIYMIFPKREGPYGDAEREITPLGGLIQAYDKRWTDDIAFECTQPSRRRGHYWVFDLDSMLKLVNWCNGEFLLNWTLLEAHETDDKDGMGHMLVYQNEGTV